MREGSQAAPGKMDLKTTTEAAFVQERLSEVRVTVDSEGSARITFDEASRPSGEGMGRTQ